MKRKKAGGLTKQGWHVNIATNQDSSLGTVAYVKMTEHKEDKLKSNVMGTKVLLVW